MTVVSGYIIGLVLSLQTLCTCVIYTLGQYIYAFYLHSSPVSLNGLQNSLTNTSAALALSVRETQSEEACAKDVLSMDHTVQAWAQQRSADLFFWINVWSFCPIIIMTYVLGMYTPALGRRFVLILPMLGTAIQLIIWLSIIYLHLPEYWWYVAAFVVGLSGSDNIRNFVLNLFITENTIESDRSPRFVLFGTISVMVSAIGTFVIGYYISWQGFTDLFWSALILQILSIFVVLFFFKSDHHGYKPVASNEQDDVPPPGSSRRCCEEWFEVWKVFRFHQHSQKKSVCLLLILSAYAAYSFICTSFIVLLLYLLNAPFCWTSEHIGNYTATGLISFGVLSLLGMKLLTKLRVSDATICIISHLCFALASLWTAFARSNWNMYAGLLLSSFSGYQNLLTLSMISKWLEPSERSHVFTLVTVLNTIMKVSGYCFFNWVYARTVINYQNFIFLLASALSIIPLVLNICLWFVSRRMSDNDHPAVKEIDLNSTSLAGAAEWPPQIGDANSILIPQQLSNLSRSNSISSVDFHRHDADPL